jgi:hypothetical protein
LPTLRFQSAAQLSQSSYQSGSGADTLWVRASDGTMWGNWSSSFSVTAPIDSGPTVTPTNSEIKSFANQNFAVSSLFSYSDPFGSPATQYDFWNTGGGGGHFVLNGTVLGANQHNIISATQLGQLSYQVGTGSDTIWVGAIYRRRGVNNWGPYYVERVQAVLDNKWTSGDVWGGLKSKMLLMAPYTNMPEDVKKIAMDTGAAIPCATPP